jgi:cell division protein FtsB
MDSNLSVQTTTPTKPGFFDNPKKAKTAFIVVLIFMILFILTTAGLSYLYWKKSESYRKLSQEKQIQIDQLNKDKDDLNQQIADLKKENEDLKNQSQQSSEEAANKKTIVQAYTEILTYFAQVLETHGGLNWTEAEYQHAREIAKKTQSSSFLATIDWAWNNTTGDPIAKIVRFIKEAASGINENLP